MNPRVNPCFGLLGERSGELEGMMIFVMKDCIS